MSIDVSATQEHLDSYPEPYLGIPGQRRRGDGRDTRPAANPMTGQIMAQMSLATQQDLTDAPDAVAQANSLTVGLSDYGFTNSASVADYFASNVDAWNIIVNNWNSSYPETPFVGIRDSGYGREGGIEGIREFQTTVFVSNEFPQIPQLGRSDQIFVTNTQNN